jgi:L-fuconolactonase
MVFNNTDWVWQVREDVLEPEREIVDPHHHLWPSKDMGYQVPDLLADLTSGHNVSRPSSWNAARPIGRMGRII